jgi:hypothetical protein
VWGWAAKAQNAFDERAPLETTYGDPNSNLLNNQSCKVRVAKASRLLARKDEVPQIWQRFSSGRAIFRQWPTEGFLFYGRPFHKAGQAIHLDQGNPARRRNRPRLPWSGSGT